MQEPRVKSTVYDMSGGLLPAPVDDGYNIAISAYTPTGPIEKTKVLSQKDFLDRFMSGTSILPTDHESAIFTYMLLGQTPVYLCRACPLSILEGIGSTGAKYLFDKSYNLIPSYRKFKINVTDSRNGYSIGYYNDDNLDDLLGSLVENDAESSVPLVILSSKNNEIVSRSRLSHSDNIGLFAEDVRDSIYYTMKFNAGTHLNDQDYVAINGTSWQYRREAFAPLSDSLSNGVLYHNNCDDAALFGLYVQAYSNVDSFYNQLSFTLQNGTVTFDALTCNLDSIEVFDDNQTVGISHNVINNLAGAGSLSVTYKDTFCESPWTISDNAMFAHGIDDAKVGDKYLCYDGDDQADSVSNLNYRKPSRVATVIADNKGDHDAVDGGANLYCASLDLNEAHVYTWKRYQPGFGAGPSSSSTTPILSPYQYTINNDYTTLWYKDGEGNTNSLIIGNNGSESSDAIDTILLADEQAKNNWQSHEYIAPITDSSSWCDFSDSQKDMNVVYMFIDNGDRKCYLGVHEEDEESTSTDVGYGIVKGCYKPQVKVESAIAPEAKCMTVVYHKTANDSSDVYYVHNFYCTSDVLGDTISNYESDNLHIYNYAVGSTHSSQFLYRVLNFFVNSTSEGHGVSNFSLSCTGSVTLFINQDNSAIAGSTVPGGSNTSVIFGVDGSNNRTYTYEVSNSGNNSLFITYDSFWVIVGNYFYYTINRNADDSFLAFAGGRTIVDMTAGNHHAVSVTELQDLLQRHLYQTQDIGMYNGYFISTDTETENYVQSQSTDLSAYHVSIDELNVSQDNPRDMFAVIPKFPSADSVFQFSFNRNADNEDIIDLRLSYKNGVSNENWTMSFVPGTVDSYGIDQWYTRVNDRAEYYQVVSLRGMEGTMKESWTSPMFGSAVSVPPFHVQYMQNALQELPNYEDGMHYDLISDAGVVDPGLSQTISSLAKEMFSVYPASVPAETTNEQNIIDFVGAANLHSEGNYETRILAAGDRRAVSGFSKVFPGSYTLILQMLSLFRNPANEFAPNFDLNHGTVATSNLLQFWKKTAREKLLDYGVETLKGGVTTSYYINNNITAQSNRSYMSEDQNVRMTNAAVHIIEDYVKNFIGELNTELTRRRVTEGCTTRIQDRLFSGRVYSPASYRVVCNEENNPISVIENNQLVVSLYASFTPSIKYIEVYHYVVPLSQVQ